MALLVSGVLTCSMGFGIWRTTRVGRCDPPRIFYAVAVTWLTLSLAGTLPYLLSGTITRFDDALFESISGFTCTGSTILSSIEGNSRGVLFWRQMTQWFGGMGVIVLAVAVLPFLSVGGLDLIRAEAPGPDADRLAPRIRGTASRLWLLYVGFTVVSFVALWLAGASPYDAASARAHHRVHGRALVVRRLGGRIQLATDRDHHHRVDDLRSHELRAALARAPG